MEELDNGKEPQTPQTPQHPAASEPMDLEKLQSELAKTKDDAAKKRIAAKEAEDKLKVYEAERAEYDAWKTSQMSEAEKQAKAIQDMQEQLTQAQTEVKRAKFQAYAAQAGVPAEQAQFLDMNRFNLDDPDATIQALQSFAKPQTPSGGRMTNTGKSQPLTGAEFNSLPLEDRLVHLEAERKQAGNRRPI